MHAHGIAHLDISLRNILTDFKGHYAFIDFETSRTFQFAPRVIPHSSGRPASIETTLMEPRIRGVHGTEDPPEIERGEESDPFKVDVWALAVVILRACKVGSPFLFRLRCFFSMSPNDSTPDVDEWLRASPTGHLRPSYARSTLRKTADRCAGPGRF